LALAGGGGTALGINTQQYFRVDSGQTSSGKSVKFVTRFQNATPELSAFSGQPSEGARWFGVWWLA
jgi:hypothetical protein